MKKLSDKEIKEMIQESLRDKRPNIPHTVVMDEMQRVIDKRKSRLQDQTRLDNGEVTKEELQTENSVVSGFDMSKSKVLKWG